MGSDDFMFAGELEGLGQDKSVRVFGQPQTSGIAVTGKGSEMELVPGIIVMHRIQVQSTYSFSLFLSCEIESSNAQLHAVLSRIQSSLRS